MLIYVTYSTWINVTSSVPPNNNKNQELADVSQHNDKL